LYVVICIVGQLFTYSVLATEDQPKTRINSTTQQLIPFITYHFPPSGVVSMIRWQVIPVSQDTSEFGPKVLSVNFDPVWYLTKEAILKKILQFLINYKSLLFNRAKLYM
jgi:hypothetical protein